MASGSCQLRTCWTYAKGKEVVLIAKTNDSRYEVSAPDGKRGYMSTDYPTFARTEDLSTTAIWQVVEPRQVRDQPFRIYRVVPTLGMTIALRMTQ